MMLFVIGIIALIGGIIAAVITAGNKAINSKQRMTSIAISVVVCIVGAAGIASE